MTVTTILTLLQTIVLTGSLTALATTFCIYIHVLRPMRKREQWKRERETRLMERQMYEDLTKWIEHECRHHKTPAVEEALKQRLKERREWFEQYQRRQD